MLDGCEVTLILVFVCVQCWKKLMNPNLATWVTDVRYHSRFQIQIGHSNLKLKANCKGFLVDVAYVNLFMILHNVNTCCSQLVAWRNMAWFLKVKNCKQIIRHNYFRDKVNIFWEGHKTLHLTFDWHYIGQK